MRTPARPIGGFNGDFVSAFAQVAQVHFCNVASASAPDIAFATRKSRNILRVSVCTAGRSRTPELIARQTSAE